MSTPTASTKKNAIRPALALVVLSPVIGEVLGGSTHFSVLFALIPEIMVWGCGALLIREIARRRNLGGAALQLMGFALSLVEEFFVQQTSLAPLPWLPAQQYGRALGVNWIYFLFMLGYESVWVVVVPVQLVELIFGEQRSEPWLRTRGLIVSVLLFLLGSWMAWYAWIRRMRPTVFHLPPYYPSPYAFLSGFLAILVLIGISLRLRSPVTVANRSVPSPSVVGATLVVLGVLWYGLLVLQFDWKPGLSFPPFWISMIAGVLWGGFVFALVHRWSSAAGWSQMHRYSCVFAAILVCMIGGLLGASTWLRIDQIAQAIFDLTAIVLMIRFGRALKKRVPEVTSA